MEEAKTKGVAFANVRSFALERFGADGWEAVLQPLAPADREALLGFVPVGWYSLPLYARLIRTLDEVHGYGDLALVVQLGRFEAERDLTTIHRMFLRLANPAYAVEKLGEYWRRFHDTGDWDLTRENESHVTGYLDNWGCVDNALCRELVGYMGRMLELVGAKNVILEHPRCRALGADRCFFRCRWGDSVRADASGPYRAYDAAPKSGPTTAPGQGAAPGPRPEAQGSGPRR